MNWTLLPRRRATTIAALSVAIPFAIFLLVLTMMPPRVEDAVPGVVDGFLVWAHDAFGSPWLTMERAERIANALLFVPVGILTTLLLPRAAWPAALIAGPVLSVLIELAQFALLPDRVATIDDIVANSLGSTAGVLIALGCTLGAALRPSPRPQAA